MANNNRTEADSAVDSTLVPTLTLAQHKALLKDEINSSVVFTKDVIASETPGGGTVSVNFANKDTATITTAVNLAISFTGIQNGGVYHIVVTKQAANVISFSGAIDMTSNIAWLSTATSVCYRISSKNGVIYVEGLTPDTIISTKVVDIGDWNMVATSEVTVVHGFGASLKYNIRGISVMIRTDSGAFLNGFQLFDLGHFDSGTAQGWVKGVGDTEIYLNRLTGGTFDATAMDATGYNRGWVTIDYIL